MFVVENASTGSTRLRMGNYKFSAADNEIIPGFLSSFVSNDRDSKAVLEGIHISFCLLIVSQIASMYC